MMIVNVPYALAWFMMYNASSVAEIFIANSLLGFGIGLMEAPIMTYGNLIQNHIFLHFKIFQKYLPWI